VRILFAINGDQYVGAIDLFFSRRLNVQDGPLNDSLEPERRLRINVIFARNGGRVLVNEVGQILA